MNKVTTIHLNGKAYQLEENGYEELRAYLTQTESALAENPDKAEIVADLEQAFAEKCAKFLSPHKDVVTASEITQIIAEMGPVGGAAGDTAQTKSSARADSPKKLYLIREGAVFAGVCTGLAAYFGIDVTIVRIIFVALTVFTGGGFIFAYFAMAVLIPYANTGEEKAAARGESFKAQDIVDRAKERIQESYHRFTTKPEWKQWTDDWRKYAHDHAKKAHQHKRYWEGRAQHMQNAAYVTRTSRSPFLGLISGLIGVLWIFALLSLVTTGALFGWIIPAGVPLWAAIIILFVLYHMVTGPIKAGRYNEYGGGYDGWSGLEDSLGLVFLLIAGWFVYSHYPAVQTFVNDLPQQIQQWWQQVRGN